MAKNSSTKRVLIDQANSRVVIATGVAAFMLVFSLVACKTLISQANYQNHVISAKKSAVHQLKADISNTTSLRNSYEAFVGTSQNVIGGNSTGQGAQDGDNASIVLDALPSSYDFPALATSLEKIITSQNVTINNIAGSDDELAQGENVISGAPQPVAMPFEVSVSGDYQSLQKLIDQFEHSIRPFQIQSINLSGDQAKMSMDVKAQTFYQPAKTFKLGSTVVK